MRAVVSHPGTSEAQVVDVKVPVAGPGQVAIDVIAAGVNPIDQFVTSGPGRQAFGLEGTVGLGWDVVGRVVQVGTDVSGFAIGDVVAGLDDRLASPSRTHAERVVLAADAISPVPDGLDPVRAASIPLNALAAAQALAILGEANGRTLLVTGAAGAVGGYAVALATASGWKVSGLARATDRDFVERAGGELITDLAGRTFDATLDPAVLTDEALAAVVDGGHYVGVQPAFPLQTDRDISVGAVLVRPDGTTLHELLERSRSGELEVRVAGTASLEDAANVYAKVAGGGQRGRWLLLP